ncbi:TPA: hypothetical protein ACHY2P_001053 [Pseudomonas aeruginosa]|uniref:hypothetical protein n=1 Tax=Pseudomonas aeruginosa TaxID=287 RepID=UPI00350FD252
METCDAVRGRRIVAGMAAALGQEDLKGHIRDWYRPFFSFEVQRDHAKRIRLPFLAARAAFQMRALDFVDISPRDWKELFDDIRRYLIDP